MNRKIVPIVALLIVLLANLACGLGGKSSEEPAATEPPAPTNTPASTNTPEPPPAPAVTLGEEQRVDDGGFAYQMIPDYTVDGFYGFVSLEAPDADPDVGPAIMMMGNVSEEATTSELIFEQFVSELEADIEASEPREIVVDGADGLAADLSGISVGKEIVGRIAIVAVTPTQHFTMFGAAPGDRWDDELEPLFEAVLASVTFFEPFSYEEPSEAGQLIDQWATSATASSEYGNPDWSAMQATGVPDTLECGDLPTAWASSESDTVEYLDLGYDIPVIPVEVNIVQTHSPNQVLFVDLLDTEGEYHPIYLGEPYEETECPYTLSILVEDADYQAVGMRITIDQSEVPAPWNEIDAVELIGYAGGETSEPAVDAPADVPPGSFSYQVTGADEDSTIVGGTIQDQSTTAEYVIGLVSDNTRYAVTLFIPHDVALGSVELRPYDESAATQGPGAAIYVGMWLYYATGGTLTVDAVSDDAISGSFEFTAVHEEDDTKIVTVAGAFDQLPLVEK
jgi:hypothetical protein